MHYLVCREKALYGGMRTSEHFPCVVEADRPEEAIDAVFADTYSPLARRRYIVVPMDKVLMLETEPFKGYTLRSVGPYRASFMQSGDDDPTW